MGNSSSSSARNPQDETVDFGFLVPQGVYTGPQDWNQAAVAQLICQRKLAPFYRPLEDYDDSWTDEQILAARRELPDVENSPDVARSDSPSIAGSSTSSSAKSSHKRANLKEPSRPEAAVYRGAVECPICFLYYPPNINHSRCCDQEICTECFVQIKRTEPTATHLVSEPAACPYCVQENFGIVYSPPPWRAGLGGEGSYESHKGSHSMPSSPSANANTHKRRQKSFGADSPEVVTIDHIRPDWEAKLAAVRAAVARRANRRIIMRQVGDRLIPVGVTSGRVHALNPEDGAESPEGNASRRSRRRQNPNNPFEQYLGQDLEELMIMEAMRLSLLEHEEQQRKEAEEKKKKEQAGSLDASAPESSGSGAATATKPCPEPTASSSPASSPSPASQPAGRSEDSLQNQPSTSSPVTSSRPDNSEGRKSNITSSPPPFSTLAAALSTTSTASAILTPHSETDEIGGEGSSSEEPLKRPEITHTDTSDSKASTLPPQTPGSYEQLPSSSSSEPSMQIPLIPKVQEGQNHAESSSSSSLHG